MVDLFFFITLLFNTSDATLPQPTQEQISLIKEMGDDDFEIRQKATDKLKEMGIGSALALEHFGANHNDPEIAHRSQALLETIFSIKDSNGEVPPCTGLYRLKKVTLPDGREFPIPSGTAYSYFKSCGGEIYGWSGTNEAASHAATERFVKDMLRSGYTKKDVTAVLDAVAENAKIHNIYEFTNNEDDEHGEFGGGD